MWLTEQLKKGRVTQLLTIYVVLTMAWDLTCCFLNTDGSVCCAQWLGLSVLIYLTSHANTTRAFNAVHLQVSLDVVTTKGPDCAYNIFLSTQELQRPLGEPSTLLSVCSARLSKRQLASTEVKTDAPVDLELVWAISCHGKGTRPALLAQTCRQQLLQHVR